MHDDALDIGGAVTAVEPFFCGNRVKGVFVWSHAGAAKFRIGVSVLCLFVAGSFHSTARVLVLVGDNDCAEVSP